MTRGRKAERRTTRMQALEKTHQMDICALLAQTYERTGSLQLTADELGVTPSAICKWMARFGMRITKTTTPQNVSRETL